nr:MAG TPA: hypothetical protein [Caudoviricetes sp.]
MLRFQSIRQNDLQDFLDAFYQWSQEQGSFSFIPSVSRYLLGE